MTTVAATSSTGSSISSAANSSNIVSKDQFLQMLVAQLKNQDPLNPMDGTQFAAQLAQFSTVEQLYNMSTSMEGMTSSMNSMNNMQITGLIGSTVTADGNTTEVNGSSSTLVYNLDSAISQGTVKIYNSDGALARTLTIGSQSAGINTLQWDSNGLTSGTYTFDISATDKTGSAVTVTKMLSGKVTGVNYKDSTPYITVNGQEVPFRDVVAVTK